MNNAIVHSRIELLADVDVLVIGGGSAGCCAAIAVGEANRGGVLLIERYGFLGGTSTGVLDTFYGFFTPGDAPRKVVGGIPDRVVDQLDQTGDIFLRPNTYGAGTGVNYNPERLKLVWDEMLGAAGVRVILHAMLIDAEFDSANRLIGVVIATKAGLYRIRAKRLIDASGDADLCHWAGIPCEKAGEIDPAQTLTTTFRMCNVDFTRFEAAGGTKMLMQKTSEAVDRGTHALPRKNGSAHAMVQKGCIATVAVRVADLDATHLDQLSSAEREGRRQAFVYEKFFRDCVPGYEESKIIGLSHQIGVRETRRVYGEYRLTRDDCLTAKRFDDVVLLCGAPIEDHRSAPGGEDETHWAYIDQGKAYDVPYRTLVPKGRDEVWVVGRCFSASHDAHASCRSMAQTMSMGQAAGVAAVMSLQQDCGARSIPIRDLQDHLIQIGAVLETPDKVAATGTQSWRVNSESRK
ncbi:FAD-dependent oxidoreductase [soil metagenome]